METEFRTVEGPVLRMVVVGSGAMGLEWMRAVLASDETELAGVVDTEVKRARWSVIRTRAGEVPVAESLDALLRTPQIGRVDGVVNVTPPDAHFPVTARALGAGLPVLGEKPMAASLEEAEELVVLARDARQLFMVAQSRTYEPHLSSLRAHVRAIGPPAVIVVNFLRDEAFDGFRTEMAHPLLVDMMVHTVDAVRYLTGKQATHVYCEEYGPSWSRYSSGGSATCVFEMDGGGRFVYNGSWSAPGDMTSWDGEWRVSGAHGSALWDGEGPPVRLSPSAPEHVVLPEPSRSGDGIRGVLADFIRALRTGRTPWGECSNNLGTLAMVHAAIDSARTGRRVRVPNPPGLSSVVPDPRRGEHI
ncbi:Gfo/Idh/MocA family oxidoreductase [Nocardiopsis sp. HNM0947]|uniref:Gfo/Idh/MocA family oxidoreductase n=1 Tax=Nocardiopsis coralli TaxID=2772213 RepID=A0ABR9P072_9ACTN|nr:Gfo/Idh/MocA family oxidoreductase [Nocardiopsis coralli]MBE2997227.1 Gfo/Idh/MocA family oxidoreductase [Nocardiopsis coralli]